MKTILSKLQNYILPSLTGDLVLKRTKSSGWGVGLLALGILSSCSDFDDYNKEVADATPSANQTLWENIQQNAQLSDFAALVKKSGFDNELSQSHYYTVWAPLNGTYNASFFQGLDNNALLTQFVKNHIADYGHLAVGSIDEHVKMLNEKTYDFTGTSSYSFGDKDVAQSNLPSNNGLMHILNGSLTFYPNIYEYITDAILAAGKDIDSLRNYVLAYEETYLDEEASVPGSIVDGMQTYVDSVVVTSNSLWRDMNIRMNNEDSTYTVLLPNNKAWVDSYGNIKECYKYAATTKAQVFANGAIATNPASITIDPTFWQDSLTCRQLIRNLFFSNNDDYNTWMEGTPSAYGSDTLRTTLRNKLSNPKDIMKQSNQTIELSNGKALVVDSLAMYSWETYSPEYTAIAASANNIGRVATGSTKTENLPDSVETEVPSYLHVIPAGNFGRPELDILLPNVLSTTYNIYCVFVPSFFDDKAAEVLPNRVIFTLNYCDASGNLKDKEFLDESEENINAFQERFNLADNASNRTTIRAFSNDPTRIDTLFVGEFTFPVCYAGLGNEYRPNIKITSPFSVFNKNLTAAFTRDLRIASIILRPKEMEDNEQ